VGLEKRDGSNYLTRAGACFNMLLMPRRARVAPGGLVYHVLNRGVGRQDLFRGDADFAAFIRVLADVLRHEPIRLCGYCLMHDHWHLVLWPRHDGQLARFMQRLTVTHVRRWVEHRKRVGWGSIYQGRYKSFPVQSDGHFLTVMRYVERNPVRAGITRKAQSRRWSSLGQMTHEPNEQAPPIPISPWPVERPKNWTKTVNQPLTAAEQQALERSLQHDRPFGSSNWMGKTEKRFNLPPLRPRGRPRGTGKRK
jgi:putative transposase